jgi:hypothetical protein
VVCFDDGEDRWLADGHYRLAAHREAGKDKIHCEVRDGTKDDAILYACGANDTHGERRTREDKENSIRTLLAAYPGWSDRKVAEAAKVSHPTVAAVRKKDSETVAGGKFTTCPADGSGVNVDTSDGPGVSGHTSGDSAPTTREGKDGKQYPATQPPRVAAEETEADREPGDDSEAAAADLAGTETDKAGTPIPEHVRPAFTTARDITAICRDLDRIIRRVEDVARLNGGRLIRVDSCRQQLRDAKGNLWANRATHVCPYCHGKAPTKGNGKPCECCKGEGWTAAYAWEQAPGNRGKK